MVEDDAAISLTWEGAQRLGLTRHEFETMTPERHLELLTQLIQELWSKGEAAFLN